MRSHRMVETDVLPQVGLDFNCRPPQLLASKRSPGERAAGYAQVSEGLEVLVGGAMDLVAVERLILRAHGTIR